MPQRLCLLAFAPLLALLLALAAIARAPACATVMDGGTPITISTESALIIWDEKAKKQHFIRRASFDTKAPYFGFLVPTPTQPELAEAPDELFSQLKDWTKPEVRVEKRYRSRTLLPNFMMSADLDGGHVTVLDRQRVGGYDAVILKASDAEKLREWLEKHGYDARPTLTAWLAPYIKAGWIITAFQIAKTDKAAERASTQAVRMSFTAERPFFPYSEPRDREKDLVRPVRLLRVFLIADRRMQGTFDSLSARWPGKAVWAGRLDEDRRRKLETRLDDKAVPLPEGAWLTVFDDHVSFRPGTSDVYFSPSADQSELRRQPLTDYKVVYYMGLDLIILLGGLTTVAVVLTVAQVRRMIRRRRRAA